MTRQAMLFPMDDGPEGVDAVPRGDSVVRPDDFSRTPRLLIRASAGTGKTFQLSNRYLSLLRQAPADRILAVTFTRKAAGEILERILTRLAAAVLDDSKRCDLAKFLGGKELTPAECRSLLSTTVRQLHRVKVATLDSFFARLATSMPLELGLAPDWSIADDHVGRGLMQQAIDQMLREGTEATTRRLVNMLAKGEIPRGITRLMTDTIQSHFDVFRMTQPEAWRRIEPGYPLASDEFEALLVELEELDLSGCEGIRAAHEKDIVKCRGGDWDDFLLKGPASKLRIGETKFNRKQLPPHVIDVYKRLIKHATAIVLKRWAQQIEATHELLSDFDRARRKLLVDSHVLRFDDIALALADRMSAVDARAVVHRLDGDIDHLLLDEFQDTSLIQWDVLRPFVDALEQRRDASFFCVGDVKQAIYGWRGGVAALFDKVEHDVRGVQSGMLNQSRRSAPEIMTAVNQVFQNLTQHPSLDAAADAVTDWQNAFPAHSTARENISGYVRLETAAMRPSGGRPIDARLDGCVGRAADIVAELHSKRPDLSVGVLTRKNDVVGLLIHELAVRGIQASEEGGVRLTTSAAVQLVQSLLRFADHPGHSIARFHVAHSPLGPLFGIRPEMSPPEAHAASLAVRSELAIHGYEAAVERWSLALRPQCSPRDWSRLRRLCVLAASYEVVAGLRPSAFADRIEEERVEDPTASAVRVMTIHKSKGLEFDVVVLPDLEETLYDTPKVCLGSPAPAERPETVLIDANELRRELLPPELARAFEQQRRTDIQESLCCLYVAMTRAVYALHMVIAPQAPTKDGGTTFRKSAAGLLRATLGGRPDLPPSTFLSEYGHANWFDHVPRPPEPTDEAGPRRSSDPITLNQHTGGRTRGRQAASPSQAKSTRGVKAAHLLSIDAAVGMDRGTLWHLWCQQVKWLNEALPDRTHLLAIGRPHCRDAARLEVELDTFLSTLRDPEIRALFTPTAVLASRPDLGGDLTVQCLIESRFSRIEEGRCESGAIDRLILYRRGRDVVGADVIDFKTDLTGAASPLRTTYCDQLRQYAAAVATTYGLDRTTIRLQLAWLTTSGVETIAV
ncbi:MAG TPA: UvrD-helicase domain-containing protein [Caulifigura sp.]|nr:UvrD-helicase domain-containing protein [Caulifigura sp.]